MTDSWSVYCLATAQDPVCTYIGATIDIDRRLRQHNKELVGGAKATGRRPGEWYRVCYVQGFPDSHAALSFEWHWKHFTRRLKSAGTPLQRREAALQTCLAWATEQWPAVELELVQG